MAASRESSVAPRALKRLERQMEELKAAGFVLVSEEYGPMATGKTTRARARAAELRAQGKEARLLDSIEQRGEGSGVQVWARG